MRKTSIPVLNVVMDQLKNKHHDSTSLHLSMASLGLIDNAWV